jgi:hypothetical protein
MSDILSSYSLLYSTSQADVYTLTSAIICLVDLFSFIKLAGCCKNETLLNYKSYGKVYYSYIETGSGISRCGDLSNDGDQWSCSTDCSDLTNQDVRLAYKGSPYPHKLLTRCPEFEIVINITAPPSDTEWTVCYISFKTERIETAIIYVDDHDGITVSDC